VHKESRLFTPDPILQLIHTPCVLHSFQGPDERAAIIIDGVTGKEGPRLEAAQLKRLESLLASTPSGALASVADVRETLVPLICPACSGPLPFVPVARVHRCGICNRLWEAATGGLRQISAGGFMAPHSRSVPGPAGFAPFYRLEAADGALYIPAARGRNPRALWSFAFGLGRRRPIWEEIEPDKLISAVEITTRAASLLAPFARFCLERDPMPTGPGTLIWIRLVARGPDWVEPGTGLGFPRSAVIPWTEEEIHPEGAAARPEATMG